MKDVGLEPTTPKPFVFVLMPFNEAFNDIFKYGIKGAAEDVGAHAERLDDQAFTEGMVDHIFSEINKADVIVADMTGRNANVFYEVGYAHALGKIVLLLTQDSNDIPFDLKDRQHTVYGGSIDKLRKELGMKLEWAIAAAESKSERLDQALVEEGYFEMIAEDTPVYPSGIGITGPAVMLRRVEDNSQEGWFWSLKVELRNSKMRITPPVESVYLFTRDPMGLTPLERDEGTIEQQSPSDDLVRCRKLSWNVPPLPKRATHVQYLAFNYWDDELVQERIRIRFMFPDRCFDYPLMIETT